MMGYEMLNKLQILLSNILVQFTEKVTARIGGELNSTNYENQVNIDTSKPKVNFV